MPREPDLTIAFLPLLIVCILRAAVPYGRISSGVLSALIIGGTGFAIAKLRVEIVRAPVIVKPMRNADVAGVVTLVEAKYPRGQRLTMAPTKVGNLSPEKTPALIRVRTMSGRSVAAPGDRVELKATLSPPAKPPLPGGFDYARTAWFDSVGAVGYAFAPPVIEERVDGGTLMQHYRRGVEDLRQLIARRAAAPAEADASDADPRPAFDEDPGELADPGEPRNPD